MRRRLLVVCAVAMACTSVAVFAAPAGVNGPASGMLPGAVRKPAPRSFTLAATGDVLIEDRDLSMAAAYAAGTAQR